MTKLIVMDVIHITLLVPTGLNTAESETISQTINDASFTEDLRRAARRTVRRRSELNKVRVRISR